MSNKNNCPRCGSPRVIRAHKRNGSHECRDCGLALPAFAWKQLKKKLKRAKAGQVIELTPEPLLPEEAAIVSQRKEELWSRLERVLPEGKELFGVNDKIDLTERLSEVNRIILQYIGELEARSEIPVGLTVSKIVEHPKRPGHLVVLFGLAEDCPRENREPLLGFLTGRLSLL